MSTHSAQASHAGPRRASFVRRSRTRLNIGIVTIATTLGLYFGLAAPSVSPVAPAVTAPAVVAASAPLDAADLGGAAADQAPTETIDGRAGHRGHR